MLLLWIAAHVLERENGDRGLGKRERLIYFTWRFGWRCRRHAAIQPHSPRAHRLGDVFQGPRTHVVKGDIDLAADLPLRVIRDANASGFGDPFEPCSDVDAIAKDIVA